MPEPVVYIDRIEGGVVVSGLDENKAREIMTYLSSFLFAGYSVYFNERVWHMVRDLRIEGMVGGASNPKR